MCLTQLLLAPRLLTCRTNQKLELERQLHEALARSAFGGSHDAERRIADLQDQLAICEERCATLERELAAKNAELSAAHAQNAVLVEERDGLQRKHFVVSVALKGSQMQVERRDKEARSMMQRIADVVRLPSLVLARCRGAHNRVRL